MRRDPGLPHIHMLPGFDGTGLLFRPLTEAFGYRCRTTSLCYEDELTLEDHLASVSAQLPPRNVILLAESFSTPIALHLMARQPARFRAAILVVGFARNPFGNWLGRWVADSFLGDNALETLLLNRCCDRDDVPPRVCELVREAQQWVSAAMVRARVHLVAGLDNPPDLSRIAAPVLYIRAKRDKLVSARLREELFEGLPQIALKAVDGPHLVLQTHPRACADAILNFLHWDEAGAAEPAPGGRQGGAALQLRPR
ncbi:MAG: hypothetical protein KatS3mg121_0708 [Gammaproteobacteria bacterium]|nr:MAG: hypothetical protein KatS3mg121_0708 [Gammaproteobacteria bacterium]